jgi:hypothetical protein
MQSRKEMQKNDTDIAAAAAADEKQEEKRNKKVWYHENK